MEQNVLTAPAVAGFLREGFIEARLHMDVPERVPDFRRNEQVSKALVDGSIALPIYVVLDPATEAPLGRQDAYADKDGFLAFLKQAATRGGLKVSSRR
jgi:hypothetical protein